MGHGCFFVFYFGQSQSHSIKEHNKVLTDFKFKDGDIVSVTTDDDKLLFVNESSQKEFRMNISMTEEEWG